MSGDSEEQTQIRYGLVSPLKEKQQEERHIEMASQRMGRIENMGDFGQA